MYGARPARAYLLSGVGVCADCASPLWANTTGGGLHNYYRCASRSRGDECASNGASCRAEMPEANVDALFAGLELPSGWRQRVRELVATGNPVPDLERDRSRLQAKIARVRQGLLDGVLDNETAKMAIREAEAALAALPNRDGLEISGCEPLTDIHELWPRMTGEGRRDLVRLVLAEVAVDLRAGEVKAMLPKPTFAPLFREVSEEEDGSISICAWRPRGDSNPRSPP